MAVKYVKNSKTLLAQDSRDSLTDAIADMMLLLGGDEDKLEEAIELAKGSAEIHYNSEKSGDSEGYTVLVDPQDGSDLVPVAEWVANLPTKEEINYELEIEELPVGTIVKFDKWPDYEIERKDENTWVVSDGDVKHVADHPMNVIDWLDHI